MKRSEINGYIKEAESFIDGLCFKLPPFCSWTVGEWKGKGYECDEIRDNMLGWDITDFGKGNYTKRGLLLVTIRNGNQNNKKYAKTYAEKILIAQESQECGLHFHWNKMEDIINRGGGILMMQLYNSDKDERLSEEPVIFVSDGVTKEVPAGGTIELHPGESITLARGMYHNFWAKSGHGPVLIGEVSECNDDNTDNRFYDGSGRFPKIEEDEEIYRYLCNEYPGAD